MMTNKPCTAGLSCNITKNMCTKDLELLRLSIPRKSSFRKLLARNRSDRIFLYPPSVHYLLLRCLLLIQLSSSKYISSNLLLVVLSVNVSLSRSPCFVSLSVILLPSFFNPLSKPRELELLHSDVLSFEQKNVCPCTML